MQTSNVWDDLFSEIIMHSIVTQEFPPWRNSLALFRAASCKCWGRMTCELKWNARGLLFGSSLTQHGSFSLGCNGSPYASVSVHSFHGTLKQGSQYKCKKAMQWAHFTNLSETFLQNKHCVDLIDGTCILISHWGVGGREGQREES